MVATYKRGCEEAWIDEHDIEHNPAQQPATDEQVDPVWTGEFGLSMEYGEQINNIIFMVCK